MPSLVERFSSYPRQGCFDEKRDLILREAARLFVERGVHETALSDLADRFSISKPALYHYARSKDDIIAQILHKASEDNRRIVAEVRQLPGTGRERFLMAARAYGKALNTEFGRCLATIQPSTFSKATLELHTRTHRILLDGLAEVIEEGIRDKSLRRCQPKIVVLALLNAMNAVVRWHRPGGALSHEAVIEEIIDYFIEGIAARPK
ncbi:TetR/AcrR family transcriptional regulator [Sinimarinibacterium sp. CAU 1509]|uniref:TetR/AcrR family transcriptional regulator n=1 Tax=Sinimarinibacterium sp. CAU 1509 TaxID=2562283 RepID=UPI0010AB609B|nr:TetR/AcrR family transcriptional regulator [Sinimarinibacterium sp. CAU 1509]TJY62976.1 TetR/AcrR family transcriptional regulator [Sinimarinibacterium sp. CAU 1509]